MSAPTPGNPKRARPINRPAATKDWKSNLILNEKKTHPEPILANALTALRQSPEWAGALAYNEFSARITIQKALPWGEPGGGIWSDQHDRKCTEWLQRKSLLVGTKLAAEAVLTAAMERPYNPCRDYLRGVVWDSTRRVDSWLTRYLGVQPSPFAAAIGRLWLVSAVARILRPGSKADAVLVLEGPQGIKKSTAAGVLFNPWFCDHLPDLSSKDSYLQLAGMWCVELAELDALGRADSSRIKSFLSSSTDRFRLPYGRHAVDVPRTSVFLGTVNKDNYLKDESGNRRFWPVRCGQIDVDTLSRERDQLWAEAVFLFDDGGAWWIDSPELRLLAETEQKARYDPDPWDTAIATYVQSLDSVSVSEVLSDCVKKDRALWTPADQSRVSRSLQSMGWERFRDAKIEGSPRRYRRKETTTFPP